MKKTLRIALILILTLAMGLTMAGCKNDKGAQDDANFGDITIGEDGTEDSPIEYFDWPSSDLPAGFPKYPDGDITQADNDELGVYIAIMNTSQESYAAFKKALEAAGYVFDPEITDTEEASNGEFYVILYFNEGFVSILVAEGFGAGGNLEWPTGKLPAGFPKYPNGNVSSVDVRDSGDISVWIENTDEKALEEYKAAVEAAGWEPNGPAWFKDGYMLNLFWLEDGVVSIDVGVVEPIEWDKGWPDDMPVKAPAFPDGDITNSGVEPWGVYVTIENTSKASYEKYLDTLLGDGWKLSGARDERKNTFTKDSHTVEVNLGKGDGWVLIQFTFKE
jgi:hypothetical protein